MISDRLKTLNSCYEFLGVEKVDNLKFIRSNKSKKIVFPFIYHFLRKSSLGKTKCTKIVKYVLPKKIREKIKGLMKYTLQNWIAVESKNNKITFKNRKILSNVYLEDVKLLRETFKYDFVVVNFANPDMVGHSGNLTAAIKACEAVDNSLKKLIDGVKKTKSNLLIVADHGNCEEMINYKTNQPHTAHTLNLVPIILISNDQNLKIGSGNLSDVAPTLLDLMKINKPREMTGRSLIIK